MTVAKGKGHLGGTFSCVDLLVALYYAHILNIDLEDPAWPNRDRFILSKGHACLALYAIFVDLGIMSQEKFNTYGEDGGLGGQLDIGLDGIDWNTGSLGHALGVGAGMALAAKLDDADYQTFVILGDAECDEGSIWEAIMFASDHNLNNLVCIIDRNRMSVTDVVENNAIFNHLGDAMNAFGWEYFDIDGHDYRDLIETLNFAKQSKRPVMIIANTIKGKGISFMENEIKWHHAVPTSHELEIARKELGV